MNVLNLLVISLFAVGHGSKNLEPRNRLYGKHLKASMGHIPPTSVFIRNSTGQIVGYSGTAFEIFDWLSKKLHFTYTIFPASENVVGININGTWTGAIGELVREEYDISLGPFAPSHERFQGIEFVVHMGGSSSWLVIKYPESRLSDSAVFEPYSLVLWMLWFSSMAAVGTMALVMVYIREERLQMDSNSSFSRIDAMLMYLLGTMSGQGGYYRTGSRSITFLAAIWCFTAFFFINIYSGILTSRYSAHYQFQEIKSLEDLANNPNYQLATLRESVWAADFKRATTGALGIIGERFRKCRDCSVANVPELMRKPLEGNYVSYIAYSYAAGMLGQDFQESQKCTRTLGNINYGWYYSFIGIRRHSPYIEELHRESLWAKAFGYHEVNENWPAIKYSIPRQCVLKYNGRGVAVQQYNVPIKMMQILPAFYLLIVGFGVALLVFLCEKIYSNWKFKL